MYLIVGNFARYPFNILSRLSLLSGSEKIPELLFMAGQFTAFNLEDEELKTAWKKLKSMNSATNFTQHVDGEMPQSSEEDYWSAAYLRSDPGLPGAWLSYGIYPDLHGDDCYSRSWNFEDSSESAVISGRDILIVSSSYGREEIEELLRWERREPIDDLGGIGWTGGEDGSAYLLSRPGLGSLQAKCMALNDSGCDFKSTCAHQGLVEDVQLTKGRENCSDNYSWTPEQCVTPPHPDTFSYPPIMKASLVRFKGQQPNHLLRRLERDDRRRGYERKLLKHFLKTKNMDWYFPPFEITEDLVLRYDKFAVEVFRMGSSRKETIYFRNKEGKGSIG